MLPLAHASHTEAALSQRTRIRGGAASGSEFTSGPAGAVTAASFAHGESVTRRMISGLDHCSGGRTAQKSAGDARTQANAASPETTCLHAFIPKYYIELQMRPLGAISLLTLMLGAQDRRIEKRWRPTP